MNPRERARRAAIRAGTRLAALRRALERRRDEPVSPGDLIVLGATAEDPVEWLVLEREGDDGDAYLVPADVHPLAGSGDIEVPAEAGGVLVVRCRFGAWVAGAAVAAGRRTGALPATLLLSVREKHVAITAGDPVGSALEREVDEEVEYHDWITGVVAPAVRALTGATASGAAAGGPSAPLPPRVDPPPDSVRRLPGPSRAGRRRVRRFLGRRAVATAAACFLLSSIGLSLWVAALRRDLAALSRPASGAAVEVFFGDGIRGPRSVEVPAAAPYLVLDVVVGRELPSHDRYQLRIADASGRAVLTSPPLAGDRYARLSVVVPRRMLPTGAFRLQLYGLSGGKAELLEQKVLTLEPAPDHPPLAE